MATRIVTFLGLGNPKKPNRYDDVTYHTPRGGQYGPTPMHDVPTVVEATGPVNLVVLGTQDVVDFWFDDHDRYSTLLAEGLKPSGVPVPPIEIQVINRGRSIDEQWSLFQLLVDLLDADARPGESQAPQRQVVDITHGFRSAPVLSVAALAYVQQERTRRANERRQWPDLQILYAEVPYGSQEGTIEDVSHVLDALRWNGAVDNLMSHGRSDALVKLLERSKSKEFGEAARAFADSLVTARMPAIVQEHAANLSRLTRKHAARKGLPPPVRNQLGRLADWLAPLSADHVISAQGIQASLALVERALHLQRFAEAAALLREVLVDIWTRDQLPDPDIAQPARGGDRFNDQRKAMERRVQRLLGDDSQPRSLVPQLFNDVGALRNDVEHCAYRAHPRSPKEIRDNLAMWLGKVRATLATRRFINCTNHPSSGWSGAQLEEAAALGFGDVHDHPFPNVPPGASPDDVLRSAQETASLILALGTSAAFVAGEHSLTFALVRALQAAGVTCFVATSERIASEEIQPDGSIKKTSEFRFVAWRRYPDL